MFWVDKEPDLQEWHRVAREASMLQDAPVSLYREVWQYEEGMILSTQPPVATRSTLIAVYLQGKRVH